MTNKSLVNLLNNGLNLLNTGLIAMTASGIIASCSPDSEEDTNNPTAPPSKLYSFDCHCCVETVDGKKINFVKRVNARGQKGAETFATNTCQDDYRINDYTVPDCPCDCLFIGEYHYNK